MTVCRLHVGDTVAEGSIVSLGFDTLEYDDGERAVSIAIGQNLLSRDGSVTGSNGFITPATGQDAGVLDIVKARRQPGQ